MDVFLHIQYVHTHTNARAQRPKHKKSTVAAINGSKTASHNSVAGGCVMFSVKT